jgi:hypothetical protein
MPIGVIGPFEIYRVGPDPDHPKAVQGDADEPYVNINHFYHCYDLESDANGLTLRFHGLRFLADAISDSRWHLERFTVEGTQAKRIGPYALYPEDFLDEWADFSWEKAKLLCKGEKDGQLEIIHEELSQDHVGSYVFLAQTCPQKPGLWQVGVEMAPSKAEKVGKRFYFMISKKGDDFLIDDGGTKPFLSCPGDSKSLNHYDEP